MKTTQVNDEKDVKTPAAPVEKKARQPRASTPEKEANAKDVLDKSFSNAKISNEICADYFICLPDAGRPISMAGSYL